MCMYVLHVCIQVYVAYDRGFMACIKHIQHTCVYSMHVCRDCREPHLLPVPRRHFSHQAQTGQHSTEASPSQVPQFSSSGRHHWACGVWLPICRTSLVRCQPGLGEDLSWAARSSQGPSLGCLAPTLTSPPSSCSWECPWRTAAYWRASPCPAGAPTWSRSP